MTSANMWILFAETGDVLYYLLYRQLLEEESTEKTA